MAKLLGSRRQGMDIARSPAEAARSPGRRNRVSVGVEVLRRRIRGSLVLLLLRRRILAVTTLLLLRRRVLTITTTSAVLRGRGS